MFERTYSRTYDADTYDYNEYIENPDKAIFLAYSDDACVGQIVLKTDWNKYALVEDICVSNAARGKGIGTALLQKAITWAKERRLSGLALETQDINLLACRFYAKCGFVIGGVNSMLYKNFEKPWCDEVAIYWYLKFE